MVSTRVVRLATIGSRKPTRDAEHVMRDVVSALCGCLYARQFHHLTNNLREDVEFRIMSGAADGMDTVAEQACDLVGGKKRIFGPWPGFQNRTDIIDCSQLENWPRAIELCRQFHPAPDRLHGRSLALLARDSYQVLDLSLDDPVDAVICWTCDGGETGGTGQAMRIACHHDVPVFNIYDHNFYKRLQKWLRRFWEVKTIKLEAK